MEKIKLYTDEQILALKERFEKNLKRARSEGKVSSSYFLEKCESELNYTKKENKEENDLGRTIR